MYNKNNVEQKFTLNDGRTIFKTHNGFKCFITDKKGKTTPVTDAYYKQVLKTYYKQQKNK